MPGWYRESNPNQRKAFWAAFWGWTLDTFDGLAITFILPVLIAVWHISPGQAGLLTWTTHVSAAFGGWLCGVLADRFGRVRLLQIAILCFALFAFLSGFAQNFEQLLILRALSGVGYGGEWALGAVLVAETLAPTARNRAMSIVQSGFAVGWGLAALSSSLCLLLLPPEYAWRTVLWLGISPAVLLFFFRHSLKEPGGDDSAAKRPDRLAPMAIFAPAFAVRTILCTMLMFGLFGASGTLLTWLPTYLVKVKDYTAAGASGLIAVVTIGAFFGYIASGFAADRFGYRATFSAYAITAFIFVIAFLIAPAGVLMTNVLGILLGFSLSGIFGMTGPFLSAQFPAAIRANAQAFTYNFGRLAGAGMAVVAGVASAHFPFGPILATIAGGSYVLVIATIALLSLSERPQD